MLIKLDARATRDPISAYRISMKRAETRLSGQSGRVDAETLVDDCGEVF